LAYGNTAGTALNFANVNCALQRYLGIYLKSLKSKIGGGADGGGVGVGREWGGVGAKTINVALECSTREMLQSNRLLALFLDSP
jgi:hypothetical protein